MQNNTAPKFTFHINVVNKKAYTFLYEVKDQTGKVIGKRTSYRGYIAVEIYGADTNDPRTGSWIGRLDLLHNKKRNNPAMVFAVADEEERAKLD